MHKDDPPATPVKRRSSTLATPVKKRSSTPDNGLTTPDNLQNRSCVPTSNPFLSLSTASRKRSYNALEPDRFININRPDNEVNIDDLFRVQEECDHPTRSSRRKPGNSAAAAPNNQEHDLKKDIQDRTYEAVLRSEIFENSQLNEDLLVHSIFGIFSNNLLIKIDNNTTPSNSKVFKTPKKTTPITNRLLTFQSPTKSVSSIRYAMQSPVRSNANPSIIQHTPDRYSMTPLSDTSIRILSAPKQTPRFISKVPYKILDAPDLQDDFYLNLVDWGQKNILSVGLGTCVYLWSAHNSKVTKLCDLGDSSDTVTSVNWNSKGDQLAVGTNKGMVQIYDVTAQKLIRELTGHTSRVGALAWKNDILISGSRDRHIICRDLSAPGDSVRSFSGHKQEVCGLKWSIDGIQLASGGNDNKLFIWDIRNAANPLWRLNDHTAAVKAIAWNPTQPSLLASGGGTADRTIRYWNTYTGAALSSHDTGSQVCNLVWSKHSQEIVSTHGYSHNQVNIWKYPTMQVISNLTGHTMRVLYLAMSPDGQNIVTGAGDETLRFWNVFNQKRDQEKAKSVALGERVLTIR